MTEIFNLVRALATSAGPWLNWKWAIVIPAALFLVCAELIELDVIPSVAKNEHGLTVQWWRLGALGGLPPMGLAVWFISTQVYLRTGRGTKVGLAYEGPKVSLSDWKETKLILKDLFADGSMRRGVSLRFVPLRATQIKTVGQRYMKRYGFTILSVVGTQSATSGDPTSGTLSLTISTKKEAEPYLKASCQNALAISAARARSKPPTLRDYQNIHAHTLRDVLLLFVATHHFVNGNFADASTLLRVVDASLEGQFKQNEQPRFSIREFDVQCCMIPLQFPVSEIPETIVLEERVQFAERAMCYFTEFASVYIGLSRARFLLGDDQGAVELTRQIKQELGKLKEMDAPISKGAMAHVHLNSGFLNFIGTQWQNAHDSYVAMLALEEHKSLDWSTLVEFVDYVRSLDRFDGIPFLQVLYRTIAHQSIPTVLKDEAETWLKEDGSRTRLRAVLKAAGQHKKSPPKEKGLKRTHPPRS